MSGGSFSKLIAAFQPGYKVTARQHEQHLLSRFLLISMDYLCLGLVLFCTYSSAFPTAESKRQDPAIPQYVLDYGEYSL